MRRKGFFILLIAWIIAIPLYIYVSNLPNSLDYFLPAALLFLLLIIATIVYPLSVIWKHYRKKMKNTSEASHIKIDKISLLLALILSITLTFLLLSTYEHVEGEVIEKGIGWHLVEGLSDYNTRPILVSLYIISSFLFCFEFIVSYYVISTLMMWKKSKT